MDASRPGRMFSQTIRSVSLTLKTRWCCLKSSA